MIKLKFVLKCFERVLLCQDTDTAKWSATEEKFLNDASFYEEAKTGFKKVIGIPFNDGKLLFHHSGETFIYLVDLTDDFVENSIALIDRAQYGQILPTDKALVDYLDSFRIDYALKFLDLDEDVRRALNIINKKG